MTDKPKWECVATEEHDWTERLAVHGGWLYRNRVAVCGNYAVSMVFVADPAEQPQVKLCGHGTIETTCAACSANWGWGRP